jgi:acyl-lipid omega-6 desaturase (Delta-12 desaturase)
MAIFEAYGPSPKRVDGGPRGLILPLALFCIILALYGVTTFAILVTDRLALLALVPLSGLLVVMLFVIGHDACHQSFTRSRMLNGWIGRIAFLPSLHVFSLWDCEHNRRHHRFNNIRDLDYAWVPWSREEFQKARLFERLKYRFYRDPGGVFFYYLFEIWPQRKIFPRRSLIGMMTAVYILDTLLVWGFVGAYLFLLVSAGASFGRSAMESIVFAAALPFLIFSMLISVAIYLHHTHHCVPWYSSIQQWKRERGSLFGTVHVRFPWLLRKLVLHIMEHNAHHIAPGVPLYNLERAQHVVGQPGVVVWDFSLVEYFNVCARCKLFDYEQGRWTDYQGRATSEPLLGERK